MPLHLNDRALERRCSKLAAQPMRMVPKHAVDRQLSPMRSVLAFPQQLVGGGVASGTTIEDDPAAGSDGGRPMYSRPAGQTAPRGAAPGNQSVQHSVVAGVAWQSRRGGIRRCTAPAVRWPSLHSKSPTQYK